MDCCLRENDEVVAVFPAVLCGLGGWYRDWRSFAGRWCLDSRLRGNDERECGNDEVRGENDEVRWWPAGAWLGTSAGAIGSPSPQSSPIKGEEGAMFFLVRQQQGAGDPAGCFGEVLDFVRLEGPAEDGALAVGEPFLEDLVAA